MEVNRRQLLVTMGGMVFGRVPMSEGSPTQTAAELLEAEASGKAVTTETVQLLAVPTRTIRADGSHFLLYTVMTEDGPVSMVWHAETPGEIKDATAFYNACRHYDGVPGVVQPPKSLTGKMARWLRELLEPDPRQRSAEEWQLIRDIQAHPGDNGPVFKYADWLTAQGSPQGEFIHVDVTLDEISADDPRSEKLNERWTELYTEFAESFVAPLARIGVFPVCYGELHPILFLNQGLVRSVQIERSGILPEHLDDLFALAPLLNNLELNYDGMRLTEIVRHPRMSQIVTLKAGSESLITPACVQALAESPHCGSLSNLNLSHAKFRTEGGLWLAKASWLPQIKELNLASCQLGTYAFRKLVQRDCFDLLRSFNLNDNRLDANSLQELAQCRSLHHVEELDLSANPQLTDGLPLLAEAAFASTIRQLRLKQARAEAAQMSGFARGRYEKLETLEFAVCKFTDDVVAPLLESECCRNLLELNLSYNELTSAIGTMLAAVPFERLGVLTLNATPLKDGGTAALIESPYLTHVHTLDIDDCGIGPEGVRALVKCSSLPKLEKLRIGQNKIGLQGARLLAKAPWNLTDLWVDPKSVGEKGKQLLRDRYGDAVSFT